MVEVCWARRSSSQALLCSKHTKAALAHVLRSVFAPWEPAAVCCWFLKQWSSSTKKVPVCPLLLARSWASPRFSCLLVTQGLFFLFPLTALCRLWRESCSMSRAGGRQSEEGRVKCSVCILLIRTYWFQWDEVSVKEKWDWQADRSWGIRGSLASADKSKIIKTNTPVIS